MTVSLCKHSHPIQPPLGSFTRPGDCTRCGTTWEAVQEELRRQDDAVLNATAHDGSCPGCREQRTLLRFEPPAQPWDPFDFEPPVSFLCLGCYNAAAIAFNESLSAAFRAV